VNESRLKIHGFSQETLDILEAQLPLNAPWAYVLNEIKQQNIASTVSAILNTAYKWVEDAANLEAIVEIKPITLTFPEGSNIILGQSHFIKTVEDLFEIMVGISAQAKFGLAFCEASGPCLIRTAGNDARLVKVATQNADAVGAGHSFIIVMEAAFPINFLNAIKQCPEVCRIYCATANPVQVVVAESEQGRGILGVIDGFSPKGIETAEDVTARQGFLRQIGYKL
jgi:adenosine/AMP kinase